MVNKACGRRVTAVAMHGPDQGFHGIGQQTVFFPAAHALFRRAQPQMRTEIKRPGGNRQPPGADQPRAQPAELAFGRLGKSLQQTFAGAQPEYGIAQKFQAFVVGSFFTGAGQAGKRAVG